MQKFVIAFYIRLSLEDTKTESMSIPNQRAILREHAMSLAEWDRAEVLEFVDNGHSGEILSVLPFRSFWKWFRPERSTVSW